MTQHRKLKNNQHEPHQKLGGSLVLRNGKQILWHPSCCSCYNKSGKQSYSEGHIHEGEGIEVTTKGTYPISFVKRLFHSGQPTRDGVRKIYEGMISTSPFGTLGLIASL